MFVFASHLCVEISREIQRRARQLGANRQDRTDDVGSHILDIDMVHQEPFPEVEDCRGLHSSALHRVMSIDVSLGSIVCLLEVRQAKKCN